MNGTVAAPRRVPVAFPPGEVVFRAAELDERTFLEVDRVLLLGACPEGRLELETDETRLMALIHKSSPYVAGLQEGEVCTTAPLYDFVLRARQLEAPVCRLVACDRALVLLTAIHFSKRPDLRGSLELINPAHVLRTLAKQGRDAAVALERGGRRTLLFLHEGRPARIYFGDPDEDPGTGRIEDRLLEWAFADIRTTTVEVFSDLTVAPDTEAGSSFARLDDEAQPPPPASVFVEMEGREIRQRPFTPPEMIIGRDPRVDLFIDNLGVSRRHARLWWDRGRFMLSDLGSSNGTSVNGRRIETSPVHEGDEVRIGKFRLRVEEEAWEPQVPETHLIMAEGPRSTLWLAGKDRRQPVDRDLLLGRGGGVDVEVRGWCVGAVHARLSPAGSHLLLTCFNRRRAEVNGEPVTTARLGAGDELVIGRSHFWIARNGVQLGYGRKAV